MEIVEYKIVNKIGEYLLTHKESIAVAESVTSGLIQASLSNATNAEQFYQGGITVYNIAQKFKHLNVEPIHAKAVNCVSQKVASEMATAVGDLFVSNWGIGITGYASPTPESNEKLFAYYAISFQGRIRGSGRLTAQLSDPFVVQCDYVKAVLRKLSLLMK